MKMTCRIFGPERSFSIGDFATDIEEYITLASPITGAFSETLSISGPDNDAGDLVSADLAGLRATVLKNAIVAKHRYQDENGSRVGTPGEASFGPYYGVSATNARKSWDDPEYIGFTCSGAGFHIPTANDNSIVWTFHPDGNGHHLNSATAVRALFQATVEHRAPTFANCTSASFRRATGFDRKLDKFDIGWITYFGDPAFGPALKSISGVEPFGDGVIVQVCDSFSDLHTPEAIGRGSMIRQALLRSGMMTK